ncbi:Hypothetical predicted protein, partial [Olea europaea subsp. europaea]
MVLGAIEEFADFSGGGADDRAEDEPGDRAEDEMMDCRKMGLKKMKGLGWVK